jgi:DNA-binding NtrC family response regulator
MPDMNGFELYQRTSELRPNLPIIMMTGFGYDPNHVILNTKNIGLRYVIYKPFDVKRLHKTIYEVLNKV